MMKRRSIGAWLLAASLCASAGCSCDSDDPASDAATLDAASGDGALLDGSPSDANTDLDAEAQADARADANQPLDAAFALACQSSECNLVTNGCNTNQACYFLPPDVNADPEASCTTAGDNAAGAICSGQQECAPGLGCDPANRCRNYCCSPGDSVGCPGGQACLVEFRDSNDESLGVGLCQNCDDCDPITSTGCAANQACYPATSDGACRLCIAPRTNGNVGASCTTSSDCRRGLGCALLDPPQCARFCSVAAGTGCDSNETCSSIGYTSLPDLGFCVTP